MENPLKEFYEVRVKRFLRNRFYKIMEISRKYATPRIKMTPLVKVVLLFLRLYLLLLVGILFYKFWTLLK
jgi:hypothetical protein